MMKRIVNATATVVEIVIDTLAENIVRKGNVRETIWMIMIITKVETVTDTDNLMVSSFIHMKRSFDREREERHMPGSRFRLSSRA
ncbi:hypothetical protein YC2023_048619 [Brassica napus]